MKIKKTPKRSLHVLDVENEMCTGLFCTDEVKHLNKVWNAVVEPAADDLFFLASGTRTAEAIGFGWPSATKQVRGGKDGADDLINEYLDVDFVASRFDHVYLGTGDHRMHDKVVELIAAGVKVTLVGRQQHIHHVYYTTRGLEIRYLDEAWQLAA